LKNQETDGLRNDASNTSNEAPDGKPRSKRLAPPKKEKVFLAVHRYENALYYKRLEPSAFALLVALKEGATLEEACGKAIAQIAISGGGRKIPENFSEKLTEWFADWASLNWLVSPPSSNSKS